MTSISYLWVISWLVIDYWRWSLSNRWVIEAQNFCGLSITHRWTSITHRWHRLLNDVIDYSSMAHQSLIGYYTAHKRHFLLSCTNDLFSFVIVLSVLDAFFSSCWRRRDAKALITNTDHWFSIVQYFTLLYGKLREWARWTKSRAVIGYPSGQDGAILPARDYPLYPASKISPKAI